MTVPLWTIPLLLTGIVGAAAALWPVKSQGGGTYNFGEALELVARIVLGVFAILIVWLVFFIVV